MKKISNSIFFFEKDPKSITSDLSSTPQLKKALENAKVKLFRFNFKYF